VIGLSFERESWPPEQEEEAHDEEEFKEGDDGDEGDEGDEEAQAAPPSGDPYTVPPPPPHSQSHPSAHFDVGGSSFTAQTPYDATFLQSFATL